MGATSRKTESRRKKTRSRRKMSFRDVGPRGRDLLREQRWWVLTRLRLVFVPVAIVDQRLVLVEVLNQMHAMFLASLGCFSSVVAPPTSELSDAIPFCARAS